MSFDLTQLGLFAACWLAGIGTVQLIRGMFTTKRDREVNYLRTQLVDAKEQIIALRAQVELLERLGFQGFHADHAEILRRLPPEPVA